MRKLACFILLAVVLLLNACSDGNSDAPPDNEAHPADWFSTHPQSAEASANYADCTSCHGNNLRGSGDAVSCYSCHSYNTVPPFNIHPPSWDDPYIDHRGYAATNGNDSCKSCHGQNLRGFQSAPSCFSASFNGQSCHPEGPGEAPHPLDGSYLEGGNHGPDAKADLTACQECHGQPGGPGSNPRFNVGIFIAGGNGCESCHGINYAHPQNWGGPSGPFHYTADNIQNACTLCHGVNLDGGVGVSCLGCHASVTDFTLDCTFCHGYPPDGSDDLDVPIPVPHRGVANISLHAECLICHGLNQSASGGTFAPSTNYALFDYATDTNGNHWDGKIQMSATAQYNSENFGCDAAGCHGNDAAHQLSDSGLPVNLLDFFGSGGGDGGNGGGVTAHALDGSFLAPSAHGPAAKGLMPEFPNGLLDCQPCHAQAGGPGSNPRFNVGIGGNGCEGCHAAFTAHPSAGEGVSWYNNSTYQHADVNGFTTMCSLCHGALLEGGIGPACTSCHSVDPVANPMGCVSCHNLPPDNGALAGAQRPNQSGRHTSPGAHRVDCSICHNGVGYRTSSHFDFAAPADVVFQAGGTYNPDSSCSNVPGCHNNASPGTWY